MPVLPTDQADAITGPPQGLVEDGLAQRIRMAVAGGAETERIDARGDRAAARGADGRLADGAGEPRAPPGSGRSPRAVRTMKTVPIMPPVWAPPLHPEALEELRKLSAEGGTPKEYLLRGQRPSCAEAGLAVGPSGALRVAGAGNWRRRLKVVAADDAQRRSASHIPPRPGVADEGMAAGEGFCLSSSGGTGCGHGANRPTPGETTESACNRSRVRGWRVFPPRVVMTRYPVFHDLWPGTGDAAG